MEASQATSTALRNTRNLALRDLLTNDADRATFDENAAPPAGGRGRSAGPGTEPGLRRGGAGDAPAGGRGDGRRARMGGPGDRAVNLVDVVSAMTFQMLFKDISLTPEQEEKARALITGTQGLITANRVEPPALRIRLIPSGEVRMQAETGDALTALLSNETDRAIVRSRIQIPPQ
jgi:hypothetical protein